MIDHGSDGTTAGARGGTSAPPRQPSGERLVVPTPPPPKPGATPTGDGAPRAPQPAHRPRISRRWVVIGAVLATVGLGAFLMLRPRPISVDTVTVQRGDVRTTIDEDGVMRVWPHATVAAPVSGRLLEESVRAGDSVRRGSVIATMVAAPLDARTREELTARTASADALVSEAQANVAAADLALGEAARARRRTDQLAAAGAVAPRDQEEAVTLEATRRRALDAARERLRAARSNAAEARAALADATPGASGAASRVPVRSPLDGRVLRVYEEHDRVVPAGTPILDVGNLRDIEVLVDVLSTDAVQVRPGTPMLLRVGETPLATRARVARVEPAAFRKLSPLGVEEQRVYVHGALLDPPIGLGDDYRVSVSIVLWEGRNVVRVPSSALAPEGAGWRAYQLSGGRIHARPVRVGHRGARDVEILGGVQPGDTLVAYPSDRVRDGIRAVASR